MYTVEELANRFRVTQDKMDLWLRLAKPTRHEDTYSVIELVSWLDLHKI